MTRNRIRTVQELEELAREMAESGFSEPEIAKYIDFEKKRTVKHGFAVEGPTPEAAAGDAYPNELVVKALYEMATSGKNATATMFWLRCRAGWSPTGEHDLEDEDIEMAFGPYTKDDV